MLLLLRVLIVNLARDFIAQPFGLGEHLVQPIEYFTKALRGKRLTLSFIRHNSTNLTTL
jgi:hypothetical protein